MYFSCKNMCLFPNLCLLYLKDDYVSDIGYVSKTEAEPSPSHISPGGRRRTKHRAVLHRRARSSRSVQALQEVPRREAWSGRTAASLGRQGQPPRGAGLSWGWTDKADMGRARKHSMQKKQKMPEQASPSVWSVGWRSLVRERLQAGGVLQGQAVLGGRTCLWDRGDRGS